MCFVGAASRPYNVYPVKFPFSEFSIALQHMQCPAPSDFLLDFSEHLCYNSPVF